MRMVSEWGLFVLCVLLVGCGGKKAPPPDFADPPAPATMRFERMDPALAHLTDAFSQALGHSGQSRRFESKAVGNRKAGRSRVASPEQQTRRHAQSAMDELDREIEGLTGDRHAETRVTTRESYTSQGGSSGTSPSGESDGPMVIAIADFVTDAGRITKLGRHLSNKLSLHLAHSQQFTVLERTLMDQVLQEQQFQVSAFVDEDTTIEFGRLVGAETIISGTLSDLGDVYYINAKAIGVTRGHLLAAVDVEVMHSRQLAAMYHTELAHLNQPEPKIKVFRARGIGIPSPGHQNPALARAMALRAAKGDAMRNLVQQIEGVQLDSDTTIKDMMTEDDTIRIQLNATLQGARVIQQRQHPDGSVEVEMEVELTEELMSRF